MIWRSKLRGMTRSETTLMKKVRGTAGSGKAVAAAAERLAAAGSVPSDEGARRGVEGFREGWVGLLSLELDRFGNLYMNNIMSATALLSSQREHG